MKSPQKILLIRPDRLGDLILSLPVAESLKKALPRTEVCYLASRYTSAVASMVDYVDGWEIDDRGDGRRLHVDELKKKILAGGFDCIIDLKPSWRTAWAGFISGAGCRIGTSRRAYSIFYNYRVNVHRRSSGMHQTDLELRHLGALEIDVSAAAPRMEADSAGKQSAETLLALNGRPYIVIHPGSAGSSPNWPLENYRQLARVITEKTDHKVVITNRDNDIEGFDGCVNLGGKTDLQSLAGILSGSQLFISGSTGPLHLADALGATCVSFFVDRSDIGPSRWGPRRNMGGVITPDRKCACGRTSKCRCLERVSIETAFNKIDSLLRSRKHRTVGKK